MGNKTSKGISITTLSERSGIYKEKLYDQLFYRKEDRRTLTAKEKFKLHEAIDQIAREMHEIVGE